MFMQTWFLAQFWVCNNEQDKSSSVLLDLYFKQEAQANTISNSSEDSAHSVALGVGFFEYCHLGDV